MKEFFKDKPVIFANLGGVPDFPGGTLPCYEEGFRLGADAACVNVQMSRDNVVMAVPSREIDGLCEGKGMVSSFTCEELKKFDAGFSFTDEKGANPFRGKGLTFLTLAELLGAFPEKKFAVTLMDKGAGFVKAYTEVIRQCGSEQRVLTSSMHGKDIRLVRKELPGSATSFSFAGLIGVYALFKTGLLYFFKNFAADALQTPEAIGASYIANRGLVREMNGKGVMVYVWHVSTEKEMKRIHNAEVNGYMSDDIRIVQNYLSRI